MTPEGACLCFVRPDCRHLFARWNRPVVTVAFWRGTMMPGQATLAMRHQTAPVVGTAGLVGAAPERDSPTPVTAAPLTAVHDLALPPRSRDPHRAIVRAAA